MLRQVLPTFAIATPVSKTLLHKSFINKPHVLLLLPPTYELPINMFWPALVFLAFDQMDLVLRINCEEVRAFERATLSSFNKLSNASFPKVPHREVAVNDILVLQPCREPLKCQAHSPIHH